MCVTDTVKQGVGGLHTSLSNDFRSWPHSNITIINKVHSVTIQGQVHITNTSRLHGKPDEGTYEHVETIKQVTQHTKIHGEKS